MRFDDDLRETIRARLAGFERKHRDDTASLKQAAVAICVAARQDPADDWGGPDDAAFLLTRRAPKLRAHSGQLALPGGRVDPGETIEQTALRELDEELGVSLGSDAGLTKGHTLDVYRLDPAAEFLGTVRLTDVRPNEAVGQLLKRSRTAVRVGDRVGTLNTKG